MSRLITAYQNMTSTKGMERSISDSSNGNSLNPRLIMLSRSIKYFPTNDKHWRYRIHNINDSILITFLLCWQATAYYYHGLILDKANEPSSHVVAVSCFLAADELLAESKKACLSFCLAAPVTRLVRKICFCLRCFPIMFLY
jgi:hypothetical protein